MEMRDTRRLVAAFLLAAAVSGGEPTGFHSPPAGAAEEKQGARETVGKPVIAAQQLLRQKKAKAALAKLREADAVSDKTPYERYIVEETRAAAEIALGDDAGAIEALEAVLATGQLAKPEALKRLQSIVQLDYQLADYARVVADAKRYYAEGGSDGEPRRLMAQAYYLQNDFGDAARTIRAVLQADEKPAGEDLLLILLNSEYQQKNEPGRLDALTRLVAGYPRKEYWRDLLISLRHQPGFAPRLALDIDRLMAATGVLERPDEYMEAAERALQAGLPGDASAVLDQGYAAGVLGTGPAADRAKRLADMARRLSGEDAESLAQRAAQAAGAASGRAWVELGEAYASHGRNQDAVAALRQGIAKGGLDDPDDAKLHLGIAYLAAGDKAMAGEVLRSVSGDDGVRELARLWLVESGAK